MTERIVTNTSPLLAFAKMQAFYIIGKLPFEFVCPTEVETEILVGANKGFEAVFDRAYISLAVKDRL